MNLNEWFDNGNLKFENLLDHSIILKRKYDLLINEKFELKFPLFQKREEVERTRCICTSLNSVQFQKCQIMALIQLDSESKFK